MKRIMIRHCDNDFVRVWDWIGQVMLIQTNFCGENIHMTEQKVVDMIRDLIPVGLKHVQHVRHKSEYTSKDDASLISHLSKFTHKIDFSYLGAENDWILDGGSEYLIIDFEQKHSEVY